MRPLSLIYVRSTIFNKNERGGNQISMPLSLYIRGGARLDRNNENLGPCNNDPAWFSFNQHKSGVDLPLSYRRGGMKFLCILIRHVSW